MLNIQLEVEKGRMEEWSFVFIGIEMLVKVNVWV